MKFDTEGAATMLENLSRMIDVERAECAVPADKVREMDLVRKGQGVEHVNRRVAGAVTGGMASAGAQVSEVDAAECGEWAEDHGATLAEERSYLDCKASKGQLVEHSIAAKREEGGHLGGAPGRERRLDAGSTPTWHPEQQHGVVHAA